MQFSQGVISLQPHKISHNKYLHLVPYIGNDGYALNIEDDGSQFSPIWPFKEYSDLWISGEFSGFVSKAVSIYKLKEKFLKTLQDNNIGILAFPIEGGRGKTLDMSKFAADLDTELEEYE